MKDEIIIPKLSRKHISKNNSYQLIIRDLYTNKIILYRVEDLYKCNPLRYRFNISELDPGNYQYYLIAGDNWTLENINKYNISKTQLEQEVGALYNKEPILVLGEFVIVSGLFDPDVQLNQNEEYQPGGGDIYMKIKILASGIINKEYKSETKEYKDDQEFIEYNNKEKYIEYE